MVGDGEWLDNLTRYTLPEYSELVSQVFEKIIEQGLEDEVSTYHTRGFISNFFRLMR